MFAHVNEALAEPQNCRKLHPICEPSLGEGVLLCGKAENKVMMLLDD